MPRSKVAKIFTRRRRRRLASAGALALVVVSRGWSGAESVGSNHIPVAVEEIAPGTRLTQAHFRIADWPSATEVPRAEELVGRIVRERVLAGEPIREERLAGSGGEIAEQLDAEQRAVRIAADEGVPPVSVGDRLDLAIRTPERTRVVSEASRVIDSGEGFLILAVQDDAALDVAAAALDGTLVAVLAP